jgi:hypothetical protein
MRLPLLAPLPLPSRPITPATRRASGVFSLSRFWLRLSSWLPVRLGARLGREAGRPTLPVTSSTTTNRLRSYSLTRRRAVPAPGEEGEGQPSAARGPGATAEAARAVPDAAARVPGAARGRVRPAGAQGARRGPARATPDGRPAGAAGADPGEPARLVREKRAADRGPAGSGERRPGGVRRRPMTRS